VYVDFVVKKRAELKRVGYETAAFGEGVEPGTPPDENVFPTLSDWNTRLSIVMFVAEPHAIRI
jgi:hypothetical protein